MKKDLNLRLTKRETEVLKLVVKGVSNPFAARELNVTESTIKAHLMHIFEKMNVQNRVQAAIKAIQYENIK